MIQPGALLIDLDGVLRLWPAGSDGVAGLDSDSVRAVLFEAELLQLAVTGVITDEEWRRETARRLEGRYQVACAQALEEAAAYPGEICQDVLSLCRRARESVPVCLLTNATTRLTDHLRLLGLTGEFDRVFNSSELGVAKPDPAVFERVCRELDLPPSRVVFVDDTQRHVDAAAAVGLRAHLYTLPAELENVLISENLLVPN